MAASRKPLGVVLAGGHSSRFGSDKALVEIDGQTLLERTVKQMEVWCNAVVIAGRKAGRETGEARCIPDWPKADMGPLGGIAAALRHAKKHKFATILTCPVDALGLPGNLPELLSKAPAFIDSQPVIGHWPAEASTEIEAILNGDNEHSLYAFVDALGATSVSLKRPPLNINRPEDLGQATEYLRRV